MATFLAHIRVRSGCEAEFEQIAGRLHAGTHEHERHVRRYEYWRGAEPSTYYTLASFDDFAGFVAHQTSDHHEDATSGLRDVIDSMRLEWLDPVPGASDLAVTSVGAVPPDASELEAQCHARFVDGVVADWWPARS